MGEKTGAELDKIMSDYDRLSEEFRQAGGFTYEADIRSILMVSSLTSLCGRCESLSFLVGKIHV